MPIQEGSAPRQYPWRRERSARQESLAMPSLGAPRIRLLNKACIPLWECYASTTKYSNVIKIEIVTQSLQLHTKKMVSTDPDHKQHKHKTKPPLHHEYRRRNHSWPNEEGEVRMDSKL